MYNWRTLSTDDVLDDVLHKLNVCLRSQSEDPIFKLLVFTDSHKSTSTRNRVEKKNELTQAPNSVRAD